MKKYILTIPLLMLAVSLVAGIGGLPFETLTKGMGIREISMGEAGTANCTGANVVFWNPAYLDAISKNEVYMSVEALFEGANYNQISFVSPLSIYGGLGVTVALLNYPSYDRTDSDGVSLGAEGSMRDVAGTVAYGKTLLWGLQAGIAAKIFVKNIDDTAYTAFNTDFSLYKPINDMVDVGFTAKNIIPLSVKYSLEEEKFIPSARIGMGIKLLDKTLRFAVDAEKYFTSSPIYVYGGAEYGINNIFFLRAGANTTGDIAAGLGISWQDMAFDYGVSASEYALSHKFALSYKFGGYDLSLKAEPEVFSPIGGNRKTYIRISSRTKYTVYKWRIEVTDGMGEKVKTWNGAGDPETEVIWDGLRSDGMPMEEGEYRAVLTVVDENDVSAASDPIKIKISNTNSFNIPLQDF